MSEFQKSMVYKLSKAANEDGVSIERQKEIYEEAMSHMAEGLLNSLMKLSREISPDFPSHVRRLRGIVDQLLAEASGTKL